MSNSTGVAVVTGSGKRRVGWQVARRLVERGYAIAVHYRSSADEARETVDLFRAQGADAEAFGADLRDEAQVRGLVAGVIERFGRLDAFVHTAAIWERKPLEQVTADDVRRHLETNTLATFLCCQHAGLAMAAQESGGSIVVFGDWAIVRPYRDYPAYFPSKGAIPALARMFAVELAARNPRVRVNCVSPGPVMLPPDLPDEERRSAIEATLAKREGSPDHVAQTVLHFIDNDFITGADLPVDGGRSVYAP